MSQSTRSKARPPPKRPAPGPPGSSSASDEELEGSDADIRAQVLARVREIAANFSADLEAAIQPLVAQICRRRQTRVPTLETSLDAKIAVQVAEQLAELRPALKAELLAEMQPAANARTAAGAEALINEFAQLKSSVEAGERQRRSKNLVAFNLPERDVEDGQAVAQQLFPGSSSGPAVVVTGAFRIGRKREGSAKPRPC